LIGNPSQCFGALPAIWYHTVLAATQINAPRLNPARQHVTQLPTQRDGNLSLTLVLII